MYVAIVPNRGSRPAILLRESYRAGTKVKNRTLANLSDWPAEQIETLRAALRGEKLVPAGEGLEIVRALPHGHGASDRTRSAFAVRVGSPAGTGAGADRGPADRSGCQAGDGARARCDDGDPLARSDAWTWRSHRERSLRGTRLAGRGAADDRGGVGASASDRRHVGALRRELEPCRGSLL